MTKMPEAPPSRHPDSPDTDTGRILNLETRQLALLLLIVGFALVTFSAFVPEHRGLGYELGHHLSRDLGIAALISGLLGCAYEYKLRSDFLRANRDATASVMLRSDILGVNREVISDAIKSERQFLTQKYVADAKTSLKGVLLEQDAGLQQLQRFRAAGLADVHEGRPFDAIKAMVESKPEQVRILETWTGYVALDKLIRTAIENDTKKVRVLLLDPDCEHVRYRAAAVNVNLETVKASIETDLAKLEAVRNDSNAGSVEIRVYDASPTVNIFGFDDIRIFGLYLRGYDSLEAPQFTVDTSDEVVLNIEGQYTVQTREHFLASQLDYHFENLWNAKETREWTLKTEGSD